METLAATALEPTEMSTTRYRAGLGGGLSATHTAEDDVTKLLPGDPDGDGRRGHLRRVREARHR